MEIIKIETVNGKMITYVKYTEEELAELKERAKKHKTEMQERLKAHDDKRLHSATT